MPLDADKFNDEWKRIRKIERYVEGGDSFDLLIAEIECWRHLGVAPEDLIFEVVAYLAEIAAEFVECPGSLEPVIIQRWRHRLSDHLHWSGRPGESLGISEQDSAAER